MTFTSPLDIRIHCDYYVITMRIKIISIGNARGIRIPKVLFEESGIKTDVEIKIGNKKIEISPIKTSGKLINETALLSEKTLAKDWNRPEEDAAWENL